MSVVTRRVGWGIADQAASSLSNFVVLVVAAGVVGRASFGALAIAFAATAMIVGVSRAVAGEPLSIRFATAPVHERRDAARGALGAAVLVGVAGGTVVGASGVAAGGRLGDALLPLAVVLPGLVLQDACRFVLVADARPAAAFLSDTVWLVIQALALGAVAALGGLSLTTVILVWGAAAYVAAGVALAHGRVTPRVGAARGWLREQRDLWPRFTAELLALTGSWQVALLGLGAIAGLDAVGALRAAQVLVGPLNVAFLAVPLVMVPESSRLWRRGRGSPLRHAAVIGGVLAGLAIAWGAVAVALPADLGRSLLGASWPGARDLLVPVAMVMAAVGVTLGALTGLRVLAAARESLHARIVTAVVVVGAILVGGVVGGATGAAWGWVAAAATGAWVWWSALQRAWRRHEVREAVSALAVAS